MLTGPGNGKVYLGTDAYNGMLVSSLTSLSYTTLIRSAQPGVGPYVNLYVDGDGDGTFNPASGHDDLLVFDPTKNGSPVIGTAQTWDALAGQWYGFHGVLAGTLSSGNTISLSQLPATARIISPFPPAYPGLSFVAGSSSAGAWSNFDGDVLSTSVTVASPPLAMRTLTRNSIAVPSSPSPGSTNPALAPVLVLTNSKAAPTAAQSAEDGHSVVLSLHSLPPDAPGAVVMALSRAKKAGVSGLELLV